MCFSTLSFPSWVGVTVAMLFVLFFYQSFLLLAYHFVYRYVIVCESVRFAGFHSSLGR